MSSSKHLVDPELVPALALLPNEPFSEQNLHQLRALRMEAAQIAAPPTDILVAECFAPGPADAPRVRMLTYTPTQSAVGRPAYLHIHGGGYVVGSAEMDTPFCTELVREHDCVVVSVDYRLAPETCFPGNVEDCYAALLWLRDNAQALGADPNRIAIGGISAGGGLAAGLALLARDRGEVTIIHQHLISPMLDDREPADRHPFTGEFVWTRESNHFGWRSLLGKPPGSPDISPYAAAARADDLRNLPPTFISIGALDLFLEENLEYARRLARAGVPVEFHLYPGGYHGFSFTASARVSQQHLRNHHDALRAVFSRPATAG